LTKIQSLKSLSGRCAPALKPEGNERDSTVEKRSGNEYKLRSHQTKNLFFENRIMLWTAQDIADFLQCSVKHVYNLVWKDEIPYEKIGGLLRFKPEQLNAWLEERTIA
jgi:excisionase family DNA binding protein